MGGESTDRRRDSFLMSTTIKAPPGTLVSGLHEWPSHIYREIPADNWSKIKQFKDQSPEEAKHAIDNPDTENEALAFGRAFHHYIGERDTFDDVYAPVPALPHGGGHQRKTASTSKDEGAENKAILTDWKAKLKGREIIERENYEKIVNMHAKMKAHPIIGPIVSGTMQTRNELVVLAEVEGHWRKALIDVELKLSNTEAAALFDPQGICPQGTYPGGTYIVDWKTTSAGVGRGTTRDTWGYSAAAWSYHGQAAWYTSVYYRATGVVPNFVFVPVRKAPPHSCAIYRVTDAQLRRGVSLYESLLRVKHDCEKSRSYPGHTETHMPDMELAGWA